MGKLTQKGLAVLLKKPPKRHPDGDGLFFKVAGQGKAYFTYRYSLGGKESETSLGPFPEMSLDEARIRHLELRAAVARKIDPVGEKPGKAPAASSGAPTFGAAADDYVERKEKRGELGKNAKHRQQWRATLAKLPKSFRDLPLDQIGAQQVFEVLDPIWERTPETASRLRGRIAAVIDATRGPEDERRNPAAWTKWMKDKLGDPKKLGKIDRLTGERVPRGNHAAMSYKLVPTFMARLATMPGLAALALRFTILTGARTDETLGMPWEEIDFESATWNVPGPRMKMEKPHRVPLSDSALAILRARFAERGDSQNPFVFPGERPRKPLSNMAMAMLLRRLGHGDVTVHGFRSSFRDWATEVEKAEYTIAERCLAHIVGNSAAKSYDRSDRLELRRPIMMRWAEYVTGGEPVVASTTDIIDLPRIKLMA